MEVTKENFQKALPYVEKAIREADFIAVDAEFTGLRRPGYELNPADTLQKRYLKLVDSANNFMITQFGLCTFRFDKENSKFDAHPFYFYIYPASPIPEDPQNERIVSFCASAFQFLASHNFDFNKWIRQGIHCVPMSFQRTMTETIVKKTEEPNTEMGTFNTKQLSQEDLAFLDQITKDIQKFISSPETDFITPKLNTFHRMLMYKVIGKKFPQLFIYSAAHSPNNQSTLCITKLNRVEVREKLLRELRENVGFRQVIDLMATKRCPVVAHNSFTDFVQLFHLAHGHVPDSIDRFCVDLRSLFPVIYDTKHVAHQLSDFQTIIHQSGLENIYEIFSRPDYSWMPTNEAIMIPDLQVDPSGMSMSAHNAAYDAYMTGVCFYKLAAYMAGPSKMPLSMTQISSVLESSRNFIHIMRSDLRLNLERPQEPSSRESWIYIYCKPPHITIPNHSALTSLLSSWVGSFYSTPICPKSTMLHFPTAEIAKQFMNLVQQNAIKANFHAYPYSTYIEMEKKGIKPPFDQ